MKVRHHIYTPPNSFRRSANLAQCREAVHEGGRGCGFNQCSRKPKVFEVIDGASMGFCTAHSMAKREEVEAARNAKYDEENRRDNARRAKVRTASACLRAVAAMTEKQARAAGLNIALWEQAQKEMS